ncbi:MAG TPA: UDP-N-acetylmuramoyl-tripeptide--D-alanyl-D-alanine ligase [Gammaproteobacteria bacterium]
MMSLVQTTKVLGGELIGNDAMFTSVSTDTRTLKKGALYFALKGERFDGHEFVNAAKQSGASAAVVSDLNNIDLPQIKVEDTRKALGRLAAAWRQHFKGKVIAITGSNGKTTAKEMIAAILAKQGDVLATKGNLNNDIGLPLTLLGMEKQNYAVVELGANHPGEIDYLTHIANPDVAVITNAGPAHLEGFGSLEGVARAKGEIYRGLTQSGVAVINADDVFADFWLKLCKDNKVIRFALEHDAEVKGEWQPDVTGGVLSIATKSNNFEVRLNVPGKHNAMNALAATAACLAAGASIENIQFALSEFSPVKGRLNLMAAASGATIIDDTYNANPASLKAGLDVLSKLPGEHWLVLGDMGELGEDARQLHADVAKLALESGIDHVYATGENSKATVKAFGENAMHFSTQKDLIDFLHSKLHQNLNVLIKGSRFMKMEKVVESLVGNNKQCS